MAGFLYFKPHKTKIVTRADVKEWGLDYAFTQSPCSAVCVTNTPTGDNGVIFADEQRLGEYQLSMNLAEQVWQKLPKLDVWVGHWSASPPQPEELARVPQMRGYYVTLGNYEWIVPMTARFDEARQLLVTSLECYLKCDDDGNWTEGDVLDVHRRLWEIGQPFRDDVAARLLQGAEPRDFTNNEICDAAVSYLQANYVVGAGELSLMRGLHKGNEIQGAIMAANDFAAYARWAEDQKKTEQAATSDGLSTAVGSAA